MEDVRSARSPERCHIVEDWAMRRRSANTEGNGKLWFWGLALIAVLCPASCAPSSSGNDHQTIEANQAIFRGRYVYQTYCAACHDATTNLHLLKDPPRLDSLFRKQTFPSGAPATDDELRNVILHGRGIMPPFEGTVSDDDVAALVQYMHTR
jgi:cytochrome c5